MTVADFLAKHRFSPRVDSEALLAEFDRQMDAGLTGRPSSLAMIPAYVDSSRAVPTDTPIIVLDAGGTNLRVAVVWFDKSGRPRIEDFQKYAMPGTAGVRLSAEDFFDTFAEFLVPVCQRSDAVGFCFSYPTEILPNLDGRLLRWSKQVDAPEVVGRLVGSSVADAVFRKTGRRLSLRVLNDTVATLLAGKSAGISRRYSSYVGMILGTGTNVAYIERNSRIGKISADPAGSMIINVESGSFDGVPRSDFDDAACARLGLTPEFMTAERARFLSLVQSGRAAFAIGQIRQDEEAAAAFASVGLEALRAAAADGLFSEPAAKALLALDRLSTIDFDNFTANPFLDKGALADVPFTEDDRRTAMAVGEPVFLRAAGLTAVNIAAAVLRTGEGRDPLHPVCVTIDGSTYYKTRSAMFKSRVEQGLRDLLGPRGVHFETIAVDDAPMIGSAVAGLIA